MIQVLQEYGISVEKVTNIVTDGGSSFCKAFKVYGKGSDSLTENETHNILTETGEENDDDEQPFMHVDGHDEFRTNLLNFGLDDDDDDVDVETNQSNSAEIGIENDDFFSDSADLVGNVESEGVSNLVKLPQQRRCLPHLLNLIPNSFEKILNARTLSALVSTFDKLQSLWVFPRRSSAAKTVCKQVLGCILKIPCEARWNSKYDAIKQMWLLRAKINEYVEVLKKLLKVLNIYKNYQMKIGLSTHI